MREVESTITAVKVYRDSALVTRTARLDLPAGEAVLRFGALPLLLTDRSVRLAPSGDQEGLTIKDIHVAFDLTLPERLETKAQEDVDRARRRLTSLYQRAEVLAARVEALRELSFQLPPLPRDPTAPRFLEESPVEAWMALVELAGHRMALAQGALRELEPQIDEARQRLIEAVRTLKDESSAHSQRLQAVTKRVEAKVSCLRPLSQVSLQLTYQVPGAIWSPTYEIRMDEAGQGEMVFRALLCQRTGEDWSQVALSLCSAPLRRVNQLPVLPSWRIGRIQEPRNRASWRPPPDDTDELFEDYDLMGVEGAAEPSSLPLGIPTVELPELPDEERLGLTGLRKEDTRETTSVRVQGKKRAKVPPSFPPSDARPMPARPPSRRLAEEEVTNVFQAAFDDDEEPTPVGDQFLYEKCKKADGEWPEASPQVALARDFEAAEGEPEMVPETDLLEYAGLELSRPTDPDRRGRLRPPEVAPEIYQAVQGAFEGLGRLAEEIQRQGGHPVSLLPAGWAHRYDVPSPMDVPSDGKVRAVPVVRSHGQARVILRVVPALDTNAYRFALLKNPLDQPLLPGPADIFYQGGYVATTSLDAAPPGSEMELNLGVEPALKVARNVRFDEKTEGLLGGTSVLSHEVVVELRSGLTRPVSVEVIEAVPVSDEKAVSIKVVSEPGAEEYDQAARGHPVRGGKRFRLDLEPGQTRMAWLRYRIEIPAKTELVGGGRRG